MNSLPTFVAPCLTRGLAAFGPSLKEEAKPRIKSGVTKLLVEVR